MRLLRRIRANVLLHSRLDALHSRIYLCFSCLCVLLTGRKCPRLSVGIILKRLARRRRLCRNTWGCKSPIRWRGKARRKMWLHQLGCNIVLQFSHFQHRRAGLIAAEINFNRAQLIIIPSMIARKMIHNPLLALKYLQLHTACLAAVDGKVIAKFTAVKRDHIHACAWPSAEVGDGEWRAGGGIKRHFNLVGAAIAIADAGKRLFGLVGA